MTSLERTQLTGIDIEQFFRDPYATGIQRVLQYLAKEWPAETPAEFVVPAPDIDEEYLLLSPSAAAEILSLPFFGFDDRVHLREAIHQRAIELQHAQVSENELLERFTSWLLPEVSYLPSVVSRFEDFRTRARTAMIGYDILPMIEPANYRFAPGRSAWVSEYFRMLAVADAVVCISDFAKRGIVERLRRSETLTTLVAHPGGDHLLVREGKPPTRPTFIRVGTMEARKMPVEILNAFTDAVDQGLEADLVYVGAPSSSDDSINLAIDAAIAKGYPVRWIQGAQDEQVYELIQNATAFLSFGVEGYGIPVLEAIRLGTPVIFGGEQPAATLMVGKGAQRTDHHPPDFRVFGLDVDAGREQLSPRDVPTWKEFARATASPITSP